MRIEKKLLSELIAAPYNPRQSTKKEELQLQTSLKKFGVVEPIIYNENTGYIVGGHFRVRELKKLGYTEIECVILNLSEEDEKELNIRLNTNTGSWDYDKLANEWEIELLSDWGLSIPIEVIEDEDEDEVIEHDSITKTLSFTFTIDEAARIENELYKIAPSLEGALTRLLEINKK